VSCCRLKHSVTYLVSVQHSALSAGLVSWVAMQYLVMLLPVEPFVWSLPAIASTKAMPSSQSSLCFKA
jgi:hypothetical protein